ncbi:Plectin/S10 N-terminal [Penicillium verrucosum]|uniref:Plectin/S10 N-terminal n=1 Tax=Penicillium verrucosum TaxID=60171 RepID=UPI002545AA24|nr:Plectin/S10 N-terminal [Penicillium verrucosum]KAJ5942012.1 Plectin/S10 N-terminal [Penicillium verrucosum]
MTHHIPSIVSQRGRGYLSCDAFYERSSTLRPSFKSTIIFGRCQSDSPTCTRNSRQCTLIPKDDRKKIHEYLFREGVLVAKKDFNLPKHADIDTKNLYVIKALQSLDSRGFVKTQFSWQVWTTSVSGSTSPAEVVPATHIKQQRSHAPPRGMMGGEEQRGERRGPRAPREGGYRRREEGGKEGGAPGEFAPSFRGGFGRGRGAAPQE